MNSIMVQTSLKFIGRKPVRRVFVIDPAAEGRLIIRVLPAAKLKEECGHFRLFRGGKRRQLPFQIHDTHVLDVILQPGFCKREMCGLSQGDLKNSFSQGSIKLN
jgi:hypothetical protein